MNAFFRKLLSPVVELRESEFGDGDDDVRRTRSW